VAPGGRVIAMAADGQAQPHGARAHRSRSLPPPLADARG
jgi:hypothetical protein